MFIGIAINLVVENIAPSENVEPTNRIVTEDGTSITTEDGQDITTES